MLYISDLSIKYTSVVPVYVVLDDSLLAHIKSKFILFEYTLVLILGGVVNVFYGKFSLIPSVNKYPPYIPMPVFQSQLVLSISTIATIAHDELV